MIVTVYVPEPVLWTAKTALLDPAPDVSTVERTPPRNPVNVFVLLNFPATHSVQAASDTDELGLFERPAGQNVHAVAPLSANVPSPHGAHTLAVVSIFPAAQSSHAACPGECVIVNGQFRHAVSALVGEYLPATVHEAQPEPVAGKYCPATQVGETIV